MERLTSKHNASLPSSLDDSFASSPSTTTTSPTTPTAMAPFGKNNGTPDSAVNDSTYSTTDDSKWKSPAPDPTASTTTTTTTTSPSDSSSAVKENGKIAKGATPEKAVVPAQSHKNNASNTVTPPDGGWGWMVVFSSFLIHVIADGIVYTSGIFLIEFVEVFQVGRGPASWIGALQPAVTFTVGPLASALTNRYGCRVVTIVGAIISAVGFITSVFAPNIYYLYATCGVLTGLGFGLIYLPAIVSVAQYFEKKRSFATGLAVCGSGFGTFILAPITEILVHEYSWRGAMLILGGFILNIIVCGILFRPLESPFPSDDGSSYSDESDSSGEKKALLDYEGTVTDTIPMISTTTSTTDSKQALDKDGRETPEMTFLVKKHHATSDKGEGEGEREAIDKSSLEIIPLSNGAGGGGGGQNLNKNHQLRSAPGVNSGVAGELVATSDTDILVSSLATDHGAEHSHENVSVATSPPSDVLLSSFQVHVEFFNEMDDSLREISASQCLSVPGTRKTGQDPANLARSDGAIHRQYFKGHNSSKGCNKGMSPTVTRRRVRQGSHSSTTSNPNTLSPLSRKDIFYSGSLLNIPMYRSSHDVYLATVTPVSPAHGKDAADKGDKEDAETNKCFEFSREFKTTMKEMMSLSLLKNPVFLMFGISNFLTSIGFNMPFIFLPDRAKLAGIDEKDAAFLLSIIGIANTCGRIIFGFLSDRSWVNRLFLYNTALTICGIATALSTVTRDSHAAFVAYAAIFGVFIGVYVSLTSVVLVDLLGLEYLTNSFGLLLLFQGAATFVGPPIAGMLYDLTGSYDISFIVMGILIALSGAMLFLLPCIQRHYNRKVPVVDIIREVEMGRQIQGDSEMAEIIHSQEIIPTLNNP